MPYTVSMHLVEARHGRPLPDLLVDLYCEHRNLGLVAGSLNMTRQNLWLWMKHMQITGRYLRDRAAERGRDLEHFNNPSHTAADRLPSFRESPGEHVQTEERSGYVHRPVRLTSSPRKDGAGGEPQ